MNTLRELTEEEWKMVRLYREMTALGRSNLIKLLSAKIELPEEGEED